MKRPIDFSSTFSSEGSEKCRNCRRRRLLLRTSVPSPLFHPPPSPNKNTMSACRRISIQGIAETVDDAVFVKEDLFTPLHFFAVYDGHGGSHVSGDVHGDDARVHSGGADAGASFGFGWRRIQLRYTSRRNARWVRVGVGRIDTRGSREGVREDASGGPAPAEHVLVVRTGSTCGSQPMDLSFAGSAAFVTLVIGDHVVVATCGDSRAVMCRGWKPIPLNSSLDNHKPEMGRTRAAGGKLQIHQNGVRVYGLLHMSRSVGDSSLRGVATSKPEITITKREAGEEECLIIASDGIWDVMSDETACRIASACLAEGSSACKKNGSRRHRMKDEGEDEGEDEEEEEAQAVLFPSKRHFAAAILCRLALARGGRDNNISAIVVDLSKKGTP